MASPPKTNKGYSAKLKALRPYVNFDYDLRKPLHSAQKAKINRYYAALREITARPNKVYRSSNRERVRKVQKFGRNEFENLPDFKVAFYPSSKANPQRLRFKKDGTLTATGKHFRVEFIEIDPSDLSIDPDSAIKDAIAEASEAKWYRVAAGKYSIEQPYTPRNLPDQIKRLMERYSAYKDDGQKANNHFENWLHGIIPMYATNQRELTEVRIAELEQRAKTVHSPRYKSRLTKDARRLRKSWEQRKGKSR